MGYEKVTRNGYWNDFQIIEPQLTIENMWRKYCMNGEYNDKEI